MAISITVKYYQTEITEPKQLQSYDLRVEVTAATEMPEEIFVMQVAAFNSPDRDVFVCIADPVDLEEYPTEDTVGEDEVPYYRVNDITLRFRSLTELEETKTLIGQDIQGLVDALKSAENLSEDDTVTYG
jgi:hypothetical protein